MENKNNTTLVHVRSSQNDVEKKNDSPLRCRKKEMKRNGSRSRDVRAYTTRRPEIKISGVSSQ